MTPPFETANRFTAESNRMVVNAERIFLNSQTFTVLSSLPDTTLSSFVRTVDVTLLRIQTKTKKKVSHISMEYKNQNAFPLTLCALEILKQLEFDRENPTV